jgi:hypothetical protein
MSRIEERGMKFRSTAMSSALLAAAVAGCTSSAPTPAGPSQIAHPTTVTGSTPVPYTLYTHCGIDNAKIGGRWFEADHPLSDGSGNPPPGWGNPFQPGTIRMLSATVAEFRDSLGHVVRFHLRAGATGRKQVCALYHRAPVSPKIRAATPSFGRQRPRGPGQRRARQPGPRRRPHRLGRRHHHLHHHDVRLTILASPSCGPDEMFRAAGLTNPHVIVPAGARVAIQVINADPDTAHGLVITASRATTSPMSMMTARPAFTGSAVWFLGNPTPAGMHAGTLTFTATTPGTYRYLCPVPGHTQQGMTCIFTARSSS